MKNRTTLLTLLALSLMLWSCDDTSKKTEGCGNGLLDLGEECDGGELQGATCASLGYYNTLGTLACRADCAYDRTECGGRCGDELVQGTDGEACDGGNLNGQTCQSLGYSGGELACGADCTFDISDCTSACGNGIVEGGEACDDGNEFSMDGCSSTCAVETGWECDGTPSDCTTVCGDDLLAGDEECDGPELAGQTCETLGYYGGTLTCSASCEFVITGCETVGRCGDGEIQLTYGEECDGDELGAQTCETLGYYGGTLTCGADCLLDLSDCEASGRCGDGIIQAVDDEVCDGDDLDGQTCISQGFVSGTLACGDTCGFETSGCTMNYESPNIGTLIYVPAGTFQRDATPTNLSVVSAFYMSQYEITRAQWVAVTGWADPSDVTYSSGTTDPVQYLSWYDAIAFCNKLSLLEGLTPVYAVSGVDFSTLTYAQIPASDNSTWNAATANWAADGYRLPTEMEWMWAAMGADLANPGAVNTTGFAKAFAGSTGGNVIDDYAWYTTNSGGKSHSVGTRLANELGFHDLSGNVWEWAWDWYAEYPTGTLTATRGPASGAGRIGRGGYWNYSASYCTVAYRDSLPPYGRNASYGFRVVRN